jgi:hypothetical protein
MSESKVRRANRRLAAVITGAVAMGLTRVTAAMAAPLPTPVADAPDAVASKTGTVLNVVMWGSWAVCIGALIVAGVVVAMKHRRGEGGEAAKAVLMPCIGAAVIGMAAGLVSFFAQ